MYKYHNNAMVRTHTCEVIMKCVGTYHVYKRRGRERRNVESLYIEILNTCSESHKIVECVTQFLNRHQLRVVVIGQTALCSVHHEVARHTIITVIV